MTGQPYDVKTVGVSTDGVVLIYVPDAPAGERCQAIGTVSHHDVTPTFFLTKPVAMAPRILRMIANAMEKWDSIQSLSHAVPIFVEDDMEGDSGD